MSSAFPKPGDTFEGKYRIERRVGQGGFAQVFLAVQMGLERKVAIKMFDPNSALESDEFSDAPEVALDSVDIEALDFDDDLEAIEEAESADDAPPRSGPPSLPTPGGPPKTAPDADASDDSDDKKKRSLSSLRSSLKSLNRKRNDAGKTGTASDADDAPDASAAESGPSLGLPRPPSGAKESEDKASASADDDASDDLDRSGLSDVSANSSPTGSNSSSQSLKSVVKRFEREAQLVSKLRSPYTVTIHDYGQTESGVLFMVMEYVDGVGFDELDLPLQPEQVVNVMRQVLMSLREAHNIGVLHRDLKPANMMLYHHAGAKDQVKLLDFGVAKVLRSAQKRRDAQEDLTDGDVLIGTPRYMSPEQILGVELDASSDIYSFGLVVFELLTGGRAITLDDEMQILAHHVSPDSFKLPDDLEVPRSLRRIVEKMLEKDPSLRYTSANDVIEDLKNMDPDTSGITLRNGALSGISQALKVHAVDISQEFKRNAAEMSDIARREGWVAALKSKESRKPLILVAIFLLVGFVSLTIIASGGDDARAGADHQGRDNGAATADENAEASNDPAPAVEEPGKGESAGAERAEDDTALAAAEDADAGDATAENADGGDAEPQIILTTVLTNPPGALVYIDEEELGESPIEIGSDAYEFPVTLRAVEEDREAELMVEEPGGEVTLELPEPEPDPEPRPERKPEKKKPKFEFKPLE